MVGARRSTSRANASAAAAHLPEVPAPLDAHDHVDAARARGLRPAAQLEIVETWLARRPPPLAAAAIARPAPDRGRFAARRDDRDHRRARGADAARDTPGSPSTPAPRRRRGTISSALRPDGKRSTIDVEKCRQCGGCSLLVEELARDPVRIAHQHVRSPARAAQRTVGDRQVVTREIELGVTELRKQHLVRVRDRDLVAINLEQLVFRALRHAGAGCSVARRRARRARQRRSNGGAAAYAAQRALTSWCTD